MLKILTFAWWMFFYSFPVHENRKCSKYVKLKNLFHDHIWEEKKSTLLPEQSCTGLFPLKWYLKNESSGFFNLHTGFILHMVWTSGSGLYIRSPPKPCDEILVKNVWESINSSKISRLFFCPFLQLVDAHVHDRQYLRKDIYVGSYSLTTPPLDTHTNTDTDTDTGTWMEQKRKEEKKWTIVKTRETNKTGKYTWNEHIHSNDWKENEHTHTENTQLLTQNRLSSSCISNINSQLQSHT